MPAARQPKAEWTQSPFLAGLRLGLATGRPLQNVNEGQGHYDRLALSVPRKSVPNPPKPQLHGQGGKHVPSPGTWVALTHPVFENHGCRNRAVDATG